MNSVLQHSREPVDCIKLYQDTTFGVYARRNEFQNFIVEVFALIVGDMEIRDDKTIKKSPHLLLKRLFSSLMFNEKGPEHVIRHLGEFRQKDGSCLHEPALESFLKRHLLKVQTLRLFFNKLFCSGSANTRGQLTSIKHFNKLANFPHCPHNVISSKHPLLSRLQYPDLLTPTSPRLLWISLDVSSSITADSAPQDALSMDLVSKGLRTCHISHWSVCRLSGL